MDELNRILSKFWFAICKQKSKTSNADSATETVDKTNEKQNDDDDYLYLKATLENIRHALNRNLQNAGCTIDIITDHEFIESNKSYKEACKELKAKGKAVVKSNQEIVHSGDLCIFLHS